MDGAGGQGERQRVFSGIQPTGEAHLGNYLGAIRNWTELQRSHEAFFCIVNLHALTLPWDPASLRASTLSKAAELLACGIDPDGSVLFVQSDVSAHAELGWVLTCLGRMGELRRMVQFKEKSKGEAESIGVGLFTYPLLQAADVLLYGAQGVPVGEDQRQHVELMRDLALRFNRAFGPVFVVPEAWIPPAGARVMALDAPLEKMSKSAGRPAAAIGLVEPPEAIVKKIKAAVTDSGREVRSGPDKPALSNLLGILSALEGAPVEELETRFAGSGYGELKSALADRVVAALEPIRTRYEELMRDPGQIEESLAQGAERARAEAEETLGRVYEATGLRPRPGGSR